jgi:hypothetical protein
MSSAPCPRLIEVALPIREISAESVRDKLLRHGHISTLHLWWARRPLAASRAVVFAWLVPDLDDPRCPPAFRAAVERHLKTEVPADLKYYWRGRTCHRNKDAYRPHDGVEDLTEEEFAQKVGVTYSTVNHWENGKRVALPSLVKRLADMKAELDAQNTKVHACLRRARRGRQGRSRQDE